MYIFTDSYCLRLHLFVTLNWMQECKNLSHIQGEQYESRANLAREYNIIESNVSDRAKAPLLVEVVKRGAGGPTVIKGRTSSTTTEVCVKRFVSDRKN